MKILIPAFICIISLFITSCDEETAPAQTEPQATITEGADKAEKSSPEPAVGTHEVGCATCIYDMKGVEGCVTAVKVGDIAYLLAGAELDAHKVGLCNGSKRANAKGEVKEGKFVATSIEIAKAAAVKTE